MPEQGGNPPRESRRREEDLTCVKISDTKARGLCCYRQLPRGRSRPLEERLHCFCGHLVSDGRVGPESEHDPKILQLIEARCDRANELKRYSAEISDTQSVTFDLNVAVGIDMTIKKMGLASNFSFEGQTRQEKRRKLAFVVELECSRGLYAAIEEMLAACRSQTEMLTS